MEVVEEEAEEDEAAARRGREKVNRNLPQADARAAATVSRRTHPLWPLDASAGVYRNY